MKHQPYLTPFAAFITIVCVVLTPLAWQSDIFRWPCNRMAISACLFYMGCVLAEFLKSRLSRKLRIVIICIAAVCFMQYFCMDALLLDTNFDREFYHLMMGWGVKLSWLFFYLSFLLAGMLMHPYQNIQNRFTKDFASGVTCFVLYLIMCVVPRIPGFFLNTSEELRLVIRIFRVVPWMATLVYVYRCVTSERVLGWVNKYRILAMILIAMCPGAIFLTVINYSRNFNALAILIFPIIAYLFSVVYRFAVKFLNRVYRMLVDKDFGWKEILIGKF